MIGIFDKALLPITLKEPIESFKSSISLISKLGSKKVILCHIIDSGLKKYQDVLKQLLEYKEIAINENDHIEIKAEISSGHIATEITANAEKNHVDYIFVPNSQKRKLERILIGSTSSDLLRFAKTPVFIQKNRPNVLKKERDKNNDRLFENIIFATDLRNVDEKAEFFLKKIEEKSSNILIFHARRRAGDPFTEEKRKSKTNEKLKKLKDSLEIEGCYIDIKAVVGKASNYIIKEAKDIKSDLIVMGKSNSKNPLDNILGSTTERVLNRVNSSLLIIP